MDEPKAKAEPEITPEMIEAGVRAFFAWEDGESWRASDLAKSMFLRMVAASGGCLTPQTRKSLDSVSTDQKQASQFLPAGNPQR